MMEVTVYCDTTGLYTEEEMWSENLCELKFPRWIVQAWYQRNRSDCEQDQMQELRIPREKCSFDRWINEVYTAEGTEGLVQFADSYGFRPTRN